MLLISIGKGHTWHQKRVVCGLLYTNTSKHTRPLGLIKKVASSKLLTLFTGVAGDSPKYHWWHYLARLTYVVTTVIG